MDALRISGGEPLRGEIRISGSKNASLPIIAAAMLAEGESILRGVPDLQDVRTFGRLLAIMGAEVAYQNGDLRIDASHIDKHEAPYDLVRTMRASILVLGPLLARFGRARVSLPGGCAIGARPIDQHLKGFERMGATIALEHGYVVATTAGLKGAEILFDMPTVGGTENLMLAASLATGTTILHNVAREPEIVDLARTLTQMGAEVHGAGSQEITITGVGSLRPYDHRVIADRIELGTYLVAGALAGEDLVIAGGVAEHQAALIDKLREGGAMITHGEDRLVVQRAEIPRSLTVTTSPYPGFPTDMQAQLMTFLTLTENTSVVSERIFENRFMHVAELRRLGANIRVSGGKAIIRGVKRLSGSTVMATDLRASASLVLAGLVAQGDTIVRRIYHLDRGYERIGRKLRGAGARIERFAE